MKAINFLLKHKLWVVVIFSILVVLSVVAIFFVNVNYDSTEYMPEDSHLKQGIDLMYDQFGEEGIAQVMVKDLNFDKAMQLKQDIGAIDGVSNVVWIDTMFEKIVNSDDFNKIFPTIQKLFGVKDRNQFMKFALVAMGVLDKESNILPKEQGTYEKIENLIKNMTKPKTYAPKEGPVADNAEANPMDAMMSQLSMFYKDGNVLMQVFFTENDFSELTYNAMKQIKALDQETYLLGNSAVVYSSRDTISTQTYIILGVAGLVVIAILFATSSSYFEPVLFLLSIGVAVILNMGTNIILPSISYMTQSVAAVLQLGLTMDYSIFLLHRYKQEKQNGLGKQDAMATALRKSFSPISASSLTTIVSFVAIMFMSYTIGLDLGIVLAKGVIFSLLSIFLLLPCLVMYTDKAIVKSEHRTFYLNAKKHSGFVYKTRWILPVIIIGLIIPCAIFQSHNQFTYGNGATFGGPASIIYKDRVEIENTFGTQNQVALVMKNDPELELKVTEGLIANFKGDELIDVQGYEYLAKTMGEDTLNQMMPDALLSQFKSTGDPNDPTDDDQYRRIILFLNRPEESPETTAALTAIQNFVRDQGVEDFYMIGEATSATEIKNVVEKDYTLITIISIVAVAIIIAITFKSILLPILLVATIQGSIWMCMIIPLLLGTPLVFIGYLIVSAILLGTTIDYAILLTNNYLAARQTYLKREAMEITLRNSSKTILTSASIFTLIGFAVMAVSTMPAIKVFGLLIGFGGLTAMLNVLILLPQLLLIFDKWIQKTTYMKRKFVNKIAEPPAFAEGVEQASIDNANVECNNPASVDNLNIECAKCASQDQDCSPSQNINIVNEDSRQNIDNSDINSNSNA